MNVKELLAQLASMEAAERPETMLDDIGSAYDTEIATYTDHTAGLEAGNAELNTQIAALNQEIIELRAQLAGDVIVEGGDDDPEDEYDIDSLFEEVN